jgi:hypothetical protein
MSHKEKRDIPAVKVSRQEAEGKISKRLTVAEYELAVIPTDFKTRFPATLSCARTTTGENILSISILKTGGRKIC